MPGCLGPADPVSAIAGCVRSEPAPGSLSLLVLQAGLPGVAGSAVPCVSYAARKCHGCVRRSAFPTTCIAPGRRRIDATGNRNARSTTKPAILSKNRLYQRSQQDPNPAHTAPETSCCRPMEWALSCGNLPCAVFLADLLSWLSRGFWKPADRTCHGTGQRIDPASRGSLRRTRPQSCASADTRLSHPLPVTTASPVMPRITDCDLLLHVHELHHS